MITVSKLPMHRGLKMANLTEMCEHKLFMLLAKLGVLRNTSWNGFYLRRGR